MAIDDRWTRVVTKLIGDTRSRSVKWERVPEEQGITSSGIFFRIDLDRKSFFTQVADKGFRLDVNKASHAVIPPEAYRLSICDAKGGIVKEIPTKTGLGDLHRAIEDQIAQIDEFLDKFLDDL